MMMIYIIIIIFLFLLLFLGMNILIDNIIDGQICVCTVPVCMLVFVALVINDGC